MKRPHEAQPTTACKSNERTLRINDCGEPDGRPLIYKKSTHPGQNNGPGSRHDFGEGGDFNPPVKITHVKSRWGVIEPGQKFAAGEDWFKGLTITVRNDSEEAITHISLKLLFPRPKGQESELDFVEMLNYGESPVPYADGRFPVSSAKAVMPGESVDLQLSDDAYDDLRALLRESKFPPKIKKLKVDVAMLGFVDDTLWTAGKRYEFDRERPGELIPLQKKVRTP